MPSGLNVGEIDGMKMLKKIVLGTALLAASSFGFGFTLLSPGTTVAMPNDGPAFPGDDGPILASMTQNLVAKDSANNIVFTGFLYSTVGTYDLAGHLEFGFYFHNDINSVDTVERLTVSSFAGWQTWVANGDFTFSAPSVVHSSTGTRSANGKVLGFNFNDGVGDGPVLPGSESRFVWIRTDATYYTIGTASAINSGVGTAETFVPTTPEPASLAAVALGLAALVRRRKKL